MKDNDDEIRNQTMSLMLAYQRLLTEHRMDEWIELWADDGICEFPYAGPGQPSRLCGKVEIKNYMSATPGKLTVNAVEDLQLHLTVNPRVVVVEMTINGTATQTGRPYNQRYVVVAETKDGKLAHYREYWNPLISAEAFA